MRLLLDTHTMLWWSLGDERLPMAVRTIIADATNQCWVSMASIWEVAIKASLGRGLPPGMSGARYVDLIAEAGFSTLDIHVSHAIGVEKLVHLHGDPFDRLMVAQARAEGMRLLTHDKALAAYGDCVMLL